MREIDFETIMRIHIPRWNELPEIDLYLDQVVNYVEKYLGQYTVDKDDKKEYHCRDCMNCRHHHMIMKASTPGGQTYQQTTAVSVNWCDAKGKEIPDTDIKLANNCQHFEEIKHE